MLDLIDIEEPRINNKYEYFLWADYIELLCLESLDLEVTISVIDRFFSSNSDNFFDKEEDDDIINDSIFINDNLSLTYSDLTNIFRARMNLFGESYPFMFDINNQTLFLKDYPFKKINSFYIFLLLSSNLRFLHKKNIFKFTSEFERIGTDILGIIFQHQWMFRHFGTATHPNIKSYLGNKFNKLYALSNDINAQLNIDKENLSKTDSGDAGFDTVCWFPFSNDFAPYLPLIFAQSGCTADINKIFTKQFTILPPRVNNFFRHICSYNIIITPLCFRDANGLFPNSQDIISVFLDRSRIISLLDDNYDFNDLESFKYIDKCIKRKF